MFPDLLLFSYVPSLILFTVLILLLKNKKYKHFKNLIFVYIFSIIFDITLWTTVSNSFLHIFWHIIIPINIISNILLLTFLFKSLNIDQSKSSFFKSVYYLFYVVSLIIFLLSFTRLGIVSYNYVDCVSNFGLLWYVLYSYRILLLLFVGAICLRVKLKRYDFLLSISVLIVILFELLGDLGASFAGKYIFDGVRIIGYLAFVFVYIYQNFITDEDKERFKKKLYLLLYVVIGLISFGSLFLVTKEKYHFLLYGSLAINITLVIYLISKEFKLEKLEEKVNQLISEQQEVGDELAQKLNLPETKSGEFSRLKNLIKMISNKDTNNQVTISRVKFGETFSFLNTYTKLVFGLNEVKDAEFYCDKVILKNSFVLILLGNSLIRFEYVEDENKVRFIIESPNLDNNNFGVVKEELRLIGITIERNKNGLLVGTIKII